MLLGIILGFIACWILAGTLVFTAFVNVDDEPNFWPDLIQELGLWNSIYIVGTTIVYFPRFVTFICQNLK